MKGSLTWDPKSERARQEKDVIKLRKLLMNINCNRKRSEKPINTLWQVENECINLCEHKMDLTTYFKKFKAMKKVVEELNQSVNGHSVVKMVCREQNISADGLRLAEAVNCFCRWQGEDSWYKSHYER